MIAALLAAALQEALEPVLTLRGHVGPVFGVAFHPGGRHLVTAGYDGTVRVWDRQSGALARLLHRGPADMNGVAVSPDGRWVAAASDDGTVRVWTFDDGRLVRSLVEPDPEVQSWLLRVAFSPDGALLAAVGRTRACRLWRVETGEPVGEPLRHEGIVSGVTFAGADRVVTAEWDARRDPRLPAVGKVNVWSVGESELVAQFPLDGDANDVAALGPERVAVAGEGGRVWEIDLGTGVTEFARVHWGTVWAVAAHAELGVVSGGEEGEVAVRGGPRAARAHGGDIFGVAVDPSGRFVASAGKDGAVRLWRRH